MLSLPQGQRLRFVKRDQTAEYEGHKIFLRAPDGSEKEVGEIFRWRNGTGRWRVDVFEATEQFGKMWAHDISEAKKMAITLMLNLTKGATK